MTDSTGTEGSGVPATNWAGNVTFGPARTHRPTEVAQLQQIVAGARRVKALGTGHSFNRIADTDGDQVALDGLPRSIEVDVAGRTARVTGGVRFGELAPAVEAHGLALHNLGSLPHISVTGAAQTGTHGSGDANGVLASAVRAMQVVGPDGELRRVEGADLAASTVGLGALGIVTELTLALVDSYRIQQYVYAGLTRADLVANVAEIMAAAYSVSIFTTWTDASQIWLKRVESEVAPPTSWLGTELATVQQTIGAEADPRSGTPQLGLAGPWYERLPHFRLEFTPSWGEEIQSEYFVTRAAAPDAIDAVFELRELLAPVLFISEIRTVARDDLWLSPASGHDVLALHFTWVRDTERVLPVVAELERRLAPSPPPALGQGVRGRPRGHGGAVPPAGRLRGARPPPGPGRGVPERVPGRVPRPGRWLTGRACRPLRPGRAARDPRVQVVEGAPACSLGEGPVWAPADGVLAYLDILAGRVHVVAVDGERADLRRTVEIGRPVGAVAPTSDGWVLAVENGFQRRDPDWTVTWSDELFAADGVVRFNDAALDPDGRFFAGTMAYDEPRRLGALYRLDPDGSSRVVVPNTGVSNGIGWSPDRRTMYFCDSLDCTIDAFGYDPSTGELGERRPFYRQPDDGAAPDGLTVDAEGGVWVALWDGGRLLRLDPSGVVTDQVVMGVPRPTSLAFAGPGLTRLYVTSARHGLTPDQVAAAPDSGRLFTFVPDVPG